MEDLRIGVWVRAARLKMGLRQSDLARLAGVSRECVSRLERGHLGGMTLGKCRAVAEAAGIELFLVPRSTRLVDMERQIDKRHAALVEDVVRRLTDAGWGVTTEYSFNHFGDRGSVDVLGWDSDRQALLIVEVKSELRDLQETLRALDIKRRVVPGRLASERGYRAAAVGVVLALPALSTQRAVVHRFRAIFDAALPARSVQVKQWVDEPGTDVRGVWFLPVSREVLLTQRFRGRQRIRLPRKAVAVPITRAEEAEMPDGGVPSGCRAGRSRSGEGPARAASA